MGQKIRVLVDRIDPVEKKIQFAVLEEEPLRKTENARSGRSLKRCMGPGCLRRTAEGGCPYMNPRLHSQRLLNLRCDSGSELRIFSSDSASTITRANASVPE